MNSQLENSTLENKSRPESATILEFTKNTARVFLNFTPEQFNRSMEDTTFINNLLEYFYNEKTRLLFASCKTASTNEGKVVEFFNRVKDVEIDNNHVVLFYKKTDILVSKILSQRNYLKSTISVINFGDQ